MLIKLQHSVTITNDGSEALKSALENSFDLIFLDIEMPVMDGFEAARRLREAGKAMPIIALSARVVQEEMELYQNAGINDAISKPFNLQTLSEKIEQWTK